jgi:hypothetical protein
MSLSIVYRHLIPESEAAERRPGVPYPAIQPQDLEDAYEIAKDKVDSIDLEVSGEDQEQMVELYNATVTDGRYIKDFATNPKSVAENLGLPISDSAAAAIVQVGDAVGVTANPDHPALAIVAIAIIVVFIIVQLPSDRREGRGDEAEKVVIDSSGLLKL